MTVIFGDEKEFRDCLSVINFCLSLIDIESERNVIKRCWLIAPLSKDATDR